MTLRDTQHDTHVRVLTSHRKQMKTGFLSFVFITFFSCASFAATDIPFTINMSEAVNVTGTPRIAVNVGGTTRYANYTAGTGTATLTFSYTMVAGDMDVDGVALSSPIDLNSGTMTDLAGNNATLTFTIPNTSGVLVDYYVGALESLPSTTTAYSVRRLKRSYKGALIRVRRSSDSTESDIGYLASGGLDTTTLTSFCSATSCFIKTWYDQSGNGNHATQTTTGNQPRIVNAGTLDTVNSLPALDFMAASNNYMLMPSMLSGVSAMTITAVVQNSASGNWARFFDFGTGTTVNMFATPSNSTQSRFRMTNTGAGGEQGPAGAIINSATAHNLVFLHTGTTMTIFQNGASLASAGSITKLPSDIVGTQNYIGKSQYSDPYFNGWYQEFVLFPSALSTTDRNALEANEKAYFGTP